MLSISRLRVAMNRAKKERKKEEEGKKKEELFLPALSSSLKRSEKHTWKNNILVKKMLLNCNERIKAESCPELFGVKLKRM